MDDELYNQLCKTAILVSALEAIAESQCMDLECCREKANEALRQFNESE